MIRLLKKAMGKWHGKMFGVSEENISAITYGWLGAYKIAIIVFCLTPFLALSIMG